MKATLDTPRLNLRQWRLDEFETFHELTESEPMRRFLGPDPPSREDSFNRMLRNAGSWALFGFGPFAIVDRETAAAVGTCALFRSLRGLGPDFDSFPEAGWIVAEPFWGRGYATEAMRAVLSWFEAKHGGGRTVAMISTGNAASERIAVKLGYEATRAAEYKGEAVTLYARG